MATALGKAFMVIRLLRRNPGALSLTAIAESVGIAPSSAHALLNELVNQGVVVQTNDKRYRMGPLVYYLGSSFCRGTPIYRSIWRELVNLCNDIGLVGAVAIPWEDHHLVLQAHQGGPSDVGVAFGGRVPLDGGSWGKAYHAWAGVDLPAPLEAYTPRSITDAEAYAAEIEVTRSRGYATDEEEFAARVGAVAVRVTSDGGYEGLASCLGPVSRLRELGFDVVGQRLAAIAAQASFTLGDPNRITLVGAE